MRFKNIKGNSFYIRGGTNTGVYVFNDKSALIIDPGLPGVRPRNIIRDLEKEGITIKWMINTHEHNDHYGAGYQFKEKYPNLVNMSSFYSKLYIDNPILFSTYIMGGNTNEFFDNILMSKNMKNVSIDRTIKPGKLHINGEYIEIIDLKGHTAGSVGVLTKDKVLFLGDMLVGEELLYKFDLLFIFDVEAYLNSLDLLQTIDFEYVVLGHCKKELDKFETLDLLKKHRESVNKYLNQIRNIMKEPKSLESILKIILNENNLSYNYKEYHFFKSTLVGMISYLNKLGEIKYFIEDGDVLYYTK
ncbi:MULTISPECIES: MBL fold metallo-hydrolase [Paraclostridium]|uniref:MBL fold metallo-hydrolase n=1 Tax=Paraclostridium bifermentans TaxID=1490 RepID=A0AA44DMG2_PARBF|nr:MULTISPECIES: MBL fold metallo-hydrolase [Paraclostridium]MBN8048557.1 MBL fold metallo-hydrolase [Paraclostridium bifermentans]MBZ6005772.1 MBL fold metallo-hydrolase [Paraclostridium bifermentans]MDU0295400.1 MBL fold metallo-hydrolase [Paraclostridium sp. MRS3W1]MDU0295413.1 MBL fold metallo-hydrolase [Paraclostridium sp. MRS3W1]NME10206.1 MBL fold metallo-hydrolase [Paraclostridium bifermentans]